MTEADGRRWIRHRAEREGWLYQPIESAMTGLGIPDGFFRTDACEGWIELKRLTKITDVVAIPFRPNQLQWLMRYHGLGGRAFLFVFYAVQLSHEVESLAVFRGEYIHKTYEWTKFDSMAMLNEPLDYFKRLPLLSVLNV